MPDDVGGPPYPDGEGPDSRDRGAADEAFADVVFDDAFVEAARIHEPSARERLLYAGWDPEADPGDDEQQPPGTLLGGYGGGASFGPSGYGLPGRAAPYGPGGPVARGKGLAAPTTRGSGSSPAAGSQPAGGADPARGRPPRRRTGGGPGVGGLPGAGGRAGRWQRPVACVLAMVMGLSVVAFALIAVQRAGSAQRVDQPPTPPASDPGKGGADLVGTGDTTRTTGTGDLPGADPGGTPPTGAGPERPEVDRPVAPVEGVDAVVPRAGEAEPVTDVLAEPAAGTT
ncbi:SCO2584 family spore wall biosynthesis protein [Streptomyces lonarensis]|uniref:Uncharacterized protein n=1 Tax=Streptomyces lonarensis TaxID=700599 RepID=A0A7X6D1K9_9ACTN|nr:hypothetical protein [Streptomyces lonarensis]NJQ06542.1 hypothetical protein [Streptomyces lonarensis]